MLMQTLPISMACAVMRVTDGLTEREKPKKTRERPVREEKPKNDPEPVRTEPREIDTSAFSDVERAVYEALKSSAVPDEIRAAASGTVGRPLGAGEVLAVLTTLEILGVCEALPGGNYALK